ncbi:MAG: hypothetical protein ACKO46_07285, partial [Alphaproteobacteria bacterium]
PCWLGNLLDLEQFIINNSANLYQQKIQKIGFNFHHKLKSELNFGIINYKPQPTFLDLSLKKIC